MATTTAYVTAAGQMGHVNGAALVTTACLTGDTYHGWFRFDNLQVPYASVINSAHLWLQGQNGWLPGVFSLKIYGVEEPEHQAPASYTEWGVDHAAHTAAAVDWDAAEVLFPDWAESPDIATVLQELVNQVGYGTGQGVGFHIEAHDMAAGRYQRWVIYDQYRPQNRPYLVVDYTPASPITVDVGTAFRSRAAQPTDPVGPITVDVGTALRTRAAQPAIPCDLNSVYTVTVGWARQTVVQNTVRIDSAIDERSTLDVDVDHYDICTPGAGCIPQGTRVRVTDADGSVAFDGAVEGCTDRPVLPAGHLVRHRITAKDWHHLADGRLVTATYQNILTGAIVVDLVGGLLFSEEVSWDAAASSIADGVLVAEAAFDHVTVAEALDSLAERSGYSWWIDPYRVLWFRPRGDRASEQYLLLDGTSGHMAYSDSLAVPTAGVDARVRCRAVDWSPAAEMSLVGQWPWTNGWLLTIPASTGGQLMFASTTNLGLELIYSTANLPSVSGLVDNDSDPWIRAKLLFDNGASGHDVKFWTSWNGTDWTQLGATVTTAGVVTSISGGASPVHVGGHGGATAFNGRIYEVRLYNGEGGTLLANPRFDSVPWTPGETVNDDGQGNTWTLTGASIGSTSYPASAPFMLTWDDLDGVPPEVTHSNPGYRNCQYLRATLLTASQVESFPGDGETTSFPVGYPVFAAPTVTVNSVAKTVGIRGVETGFDWYWNQGDAVISQDSAGTVLESDDVLAVTYVGTYQTVVSAEDPVEIGRWQARAGYGTGRVEVVDDYPAVVSAADADAAADALLDKWAQDGITLSFTTVRTGLAPGQILTVDLPEYGFTDSTFLITRIVTTDEDNKILRYRVQAVQGPVMDSWAKVWSKSLRL